MYNYSDKFKDAIYNDQRRFKINIAVTLASGATLTITEADIWQGTMSVDSATSGSGEFSVGAAVASKLIFALNNNKDTYSSYDFIDARLNLQVGAILPDDTIEFEQYGVYTITEASFSENSITITALDNISKFSYPYGGEFAFPLTLEQIIIRSCNACGVVLDADSVPSEMKTYTVSELNVNPDSLTYIGLISYAAQTAGSFAKADHQGRLTFGWYDTSLLAESYDGGTFEYNGRTYDDKPEAELDGGTFSYDDGDYADGGSFSDFDAIHYITAHLSADIATDDIRITGVRVVSASSDSEKEPESFFVGAPGYVIEINSNPLIQGNQCAVAAQQVFNKVGGMFFRPLSASILPDPAIEAGDVAFVLGKNDTPYPIFVSSYKFCPDASCAIACDAQSKNRHSITNQNAVTVAIEEAKKWIAYEKSAREVALENMTNLMSNALGYHATTIDMPGGGQITYIHNKPNLDDSDIRWCFTEQGFMVSTDYGRTWRAGFDASGNAVVNVLSAVGINADWINAGTITGRTINGGTVTGATIISTGADGKSTTIQGGTIVSNDVNITGGTINIQTQSERQDIISLRYGDNSIELWPLGIQVRDKNSGAYIILNAGQITVLDDDGKMFIYDKGKIYEGDNWLENKYATISSFNNLSNFVSEIVGSVGRTALDAWRMADDAKTDLSNHLESTKAHNAQNIELTGIGNYKNVYEILLFLYSRVIGG